MSYSLSMPARAIRVALLAALSAVPVSAQCIGFLPESTRVPGVTDGLNLGQVDCSLAWTPPGAPAPRLVVGGSFSVAGSFVAKNIAIFDPATNLWSPLSTGLDGRVSDLAVAPNGDLIAVGDFAFAGASAASKVARWNGTTWSSVGTGHGTTNGLVRAVKVAANGNIFVGGDFTNIGGMAADHVAVFNGSTWSRLSSGVDNSVSALEFMPNGDLAVGGNFTTAGGVAAGSFAVWNGGSWSVPFTLNNWVDSLCTAFGSIHISGAFTQVSGAPSSSIISFDGTNWNLGIGLAGVAKKMARQPNGSLLFFGGSLNFGAGNQDVVRLTTTGFQNVVSAAAGPFTGCALSNTSIAIGGQFELDGGGFPAKNVALVSGSSYVGAGVATALMTPSGDLFGARALLSNGFVQVVAGSFGVDSASSSPAMMRQLAIGGGWANWGTFATWIGEGNAILQTGATGGTPPLVLGGTFSVSNGAPDENIASWNGTSWSPMGGGVNGSVFALTMLGTDVIAGGAFTSAGGSAAAGVARWNGTAWSSLGLGVNGQVNALAVVNGRVWVGGSFTTAGGQPANNVAVFDPTTSTWSAPGSGVNGIVLSILAWQGSVVVGGQFTQAGVAIANGMARFDGTTWHSMGANFSSVPTMATMPNGDIIAGVTTATGFDLARGDGTAWQLLGAFNGFVNAIQPVDMLRVDVVGSFTVAGGQPAVDIVRLASNCAPSITSPGGSACATATGAFGAFQTTSTAQNNLPFLGRSTTLSAIVGTLTAVPAVTVYVVGAPIAPQDLSITLGIGGTPCFFYTAPDLVMGLALTPGGGFATVSLVIPVPNVPALIGTVYNTQVLSLYAVSGSTVAGTSDVRTLTLGSF